MFRPPYWMQDAALAAEDAHRERRLEHIRGLRLNVVSETDSGWDLARRAWNLAADQRPPHVAFPETTDDVVKLVTFAGDDGLRVAPQGTGHGAGPLGAIEDAVLMRPSRMRDVAIDPGQRRARVGAGVTWGEVQAAAAAHGLAGLAGSSPEIGVVGYTLGGGLGWLARRYGLACNSVLAIDVVTADGRLLRVDREHEPDLFWALRGGGGSFGIVTALEFALYPVRELYAGALFWPQERAAEILQAWQAWTAGVPDSVTSVGRLLNLPALPEVPEGLRGRSFVLVEAACLATEGEGIELLRPLRERGPEIDTFAMLPPTALGALHMDPVDPVPASIDGWLLADLPSAAIDALVEAAGPGSGSPLLSVELRHLGGALRRRCAGTRGAGLARRPVRDRHDQPGAERGHGRRRGASFRHRAGRAGTVGGGAELPQLRRAILQCVGFLLARDLRTARPRQGPVRPARPHSIDASDPAGVTPACAAPARRDRLNSAHPGCFGQHSPAASGLPG